MKRLFMVIWFVLAMVGFAFAAGDIAAAQESPFAAVMENTIQPMVLSLLATIVGIAVAYLTNLLKKKFGIEISNATNERIRTVAFDAVHAVEEKAAQALNNSGTRWVSESKHSAAINYILAQVPTISPEQADVLVNSSLAQVKGLGATASLGKA